MHGGRRRFHIPPCHAEPAAREVVLKSAGWRGGGFPAHEKCPAPTRRAGHFRVRLSGRYNALYLAAPWGLQGVRPGTPRDPILRLRTRIQRALAGPAVFGPLPPFLPPVDRGWGRYPPRRQKPACGLAAGDVGLETGTIRSCPKDRHPRDGPPHCPFRFPSTGYTGAGVKIKNRGRNREHHGGDTARRGYFFSSLTLKSVNLRPRSFDYGSLCT